MKLDDLYWELSELGIRPRVTPSGGLQVTNAGALTDELRAALRQHKAAIIRNMTMPLVDYVLEVFGGEVRDENGRKIKHTPGDGGMFT